MQPRSRDRGVAAMTMVIKFLPVRAGLALSELFRSKRCHDFFETRIAAERIPIGKEFELAVAQRTGKLDRLSELFAGQIFVANPGGNHRVILNHMRAVD